MSTMNVSKVRLLIIKPICVWINLLSDESLSVSVYSTFHGQTFITVYAFISTSTYISLVYRINQIHRR